MAEADVPVRVLSYKNTHKVMAENCQLSAGGGREQICTVVRQCLLRVRDSRETKTEEELDQNQPRKGSKGKGPF